MKTLFILLSEPPIKTDSMPGYGPGGIIALMILAYLLYALMKPDKL